MADHKSTTNTEWTQS